MTEQQLLKQVLDGLSYYQGKYWRMNSGAMAREYTDKTGKVKKGFYRFNSAKGLSDIIGIHSSGRFVAIELKVGKNKPTEAQQTFIDAINYHGGIGIIAYSWDDVEKCLKNI